MTSSNNWWLQNSPLLCNFLPFCQFVYHLSLSVWTVRGLAFQIREYSSSNWTKI